MVSYSGSVENIFCPLLFFSRHDPYSSLTNRTRIVCSPLIPRFRPSRAATTCGSTSLRARSLRGALRINPLALSPSPHWEVVPAKQLKSTSCLLPTHFPPGSGSFFRKSTSGLKGKIFPAVNTEPIQKETTPLLHAALPVVESVLASVDRRLPAHVSRDDLASAAKLALIEAVGRFTGPLDEVRAYCYTRVRGAVYDELRRLDPLSRRTRVQVNLVRRAATELESALGRQPTSQEVSRATGLRSEKVRQLDRIATASEPCSLQATDADGNPLLDLPDRDSPCPAKSVESDEYNEVVKDALSRLPVNQALVVRRYYFEEATLDEIAGELRVSRERIRQLREAAEKRLRSDVMILALWESQHAAA